MRPRAVAATLMMVAAIGCACSGSTAAAVPKPSPSASSSLAQGCASPEAAEFDFWVGTWRGTWTDSQGQATASDAVVSTGCEIDETFQAARFLGHTGYSATSRSHWDLALGKWVQDYSDSVGERSRWLGAFAGGSMTLIGPQVGGRQQRVIWKDIHPNGWIWEYDSSTDGTTWAALLIVTYQRT